MSTTNSAKCYADSWETYDEEDKDDIFAAPSSPPPVHVTESYCQVSRPMDYAHYKNTVLQPVVLDKSERKSTGDTEKQVSVHAKTLLSYLFKKNNILVIINLLSKIWKKRDLIQKVGKEYMTATLHKGIRAGTKIHHHHAHRSAITSTLVILAAINSSSNVLAKKGVHWASKSIHSMGGLDSVILALSTIALTKSAQRSARIF